MSEQLFEFFSDASQPDEEFMSKALVVYSTMAVTYGHSPEQEVDPDLVWSEVAAGMQAWDRFDIDFDKAVYSLAGLLDEPSVRTRLFEKANQRLSKDGE